MLYMYHAMIGMHALLVFFFMNRRVRLQIPKATLFMKYFTLGLFLSNGILMYMNDFDLVNFFSSTGMFNSYVDDKYAELIEYVLSPDK